jgi:uncharacterized protein (DUF1501 family)
MPQRRDILKALGATTGALLMGPRFALARADTDARLVVILQRGAQDGLQALVPHADPAYRRLRPRIAIPAPGAEGGALRLDGTFALHPRLTTLHALWGEGELAVIPAIATRYRDRSHFDGQNLLENGAGAPFAADDGFLNRALGGYRAGERRFGMAFGHAVPLAMRGGAPIRVWAPSALPDVDEDFLRRLLATYEEDALFAAALRDALDMGDDGLTASEARQAARGQDPTLAAEAAAAALVEADGPRVAFLESFGWDTHYGAPQRMDQLFAGLDATIATLKRGLAPVWDRTVIVTLSEFGRTAAENGSQGTDHGTGGTSFLMGGSVRGGRVVGDWPGLATAALYEGRDVYPANATEALLKAALGGHLGLAPGFVEDEVLPGTRTIAPLEGLFRS